MLLWHFLQRTFSKAKRIAAEKQLKASVLCRFVASFHEWVGLYNQKLNTFGLFFYSPKSWDSFILLYTLFERRHEYIAISSISSYAQRWSARPHADGHHPCHIWLVLALQCLPPGQTQMETEEAGEPTPGLFGHFVYHYCERSATIGSWVVKCCLP